jgi:hypothetical protein
MTARSSTTTTNTGLAVAGRLEPLGPCLGFSASRMAVQRPSRIQNASDLPGLRCPTLGLVQHHDLWRRHPATTPSGFGKFLHHGVNLRYRRAGRTLTLNRHKHHTGHDYVLGRHQRALNRIYGRLPGSRQHALVAAGAAHGAHHRASLTCVASRAEAERAPVLCRNLLARSLRHARALQRCGARGAWVQGLGNRARGAHYAGSRTTSGTSLTAGHNTPCVPSSYAAYVTPGSALLTGAPF